MKNISHFLFAALLTTNINANAAPSEHTDKAFGPYFKSLKNAMNQGCCDVSDCRVLGVTKYKQKEDGSWSAFIGKEDFGATAPDDWISVPPEIILKREDNPTSGAIACWSVNQSSDRGALRYNGYYCFTKPQLDL
jgi:hypothetical protein